jgi:hypothetical protein
MMSACTTGDLGDEVNGSGKRNAAHEALRHSIVCMAAALQPQY